MTSAERCAACVLVRAPSRDPAYIRKRMGQISGIRWAHKIRGPDDYVIMFDVTDHAHLRYSIDQELRRLVEDRLIESTETMPIDPPPEDRISVEERSPSGSSAFLFCKTDDADPLPVIESFRRMSGVMVAFGLFGSVYSMFALVRANTPDALTDLIDRKLRLVPGVAKIDTRNVVQERET